MKEIYPDPKDVGLNGFADIVVGAREDDIREFDNLNNRFVGGRKVSKIPSNSADVVAADQEGDINYDAAFLYILLDDAGTLVWRRVALAAF